ncbi:hypothetical protein BHS06_01780 [Myxococcus xanthus]|nr:hypothetical protein BHS06_01780 [Myxococcus xanthus]
MKWTPPPPLDLSLSAPMNRLILLSLLLLPGLASSATDEGKLAFEKACARCHVVTAQGQKKAKAAAKAPNSRRREPSVDLGPVVPMRTPDQLRAWLAGPNQIKPKTGCDTRLLPDGDRELLLTYLALSLHPTPPTREEQLRLQLKQDLAARQAQKQRQADEPSRRSQGKK